MKIRRSSPPNRAVSMLEVPLIVAILGLLGWLLSASWVVSSFFLRLQRTALPPRNCDSHFLSSSCAFQTRGVGGEKPVVKPPVSPPQLAPRPGLPCIASERRRAVAAEFRESSTSHCEHTPESPNSITPRRPPQVRRSAFRRRGVRIETCLPNVQQRKRASQSPNLLLSSDRDLTSGPGPLDGVLTLSTNQSACWLGKIHHGAGNIAITDGSVQQLTSSGLNTAVLHSGATNWLLFP